MSDADTTDLPGGSGGDEGQGAVVNPFEMVQEIERILADDPGDRERSENCIEFPLPDALKLIPHRYLKEVDPEDVYGETVLVEPDDLFGQLAAGKVEVPLSKLAYYIPLHLIYHAALDEETQIELPLKKVVKAIGLEELSSRTPQNFRLYDISVFDDPFKEGEFSPSEDAGALVFDDAEEDAGAGLVFDDGVEPEAPVSEAAVAEETAAATSAAEEPATEAEVPLVKEEREEEAAVEETEEAIAPAEEPAAEKKEEEPQKTEPPPPAGDTSSISYTVESIVAALPEGVAAVEQDAGKMVDLPVPEVISQLRRGVVTMSTTDVLSALPENVVKSMESVASDGITRSDLKQTVASVGLDKLAELTPSGVRAYDIDWMADPFEEPDEKPDLEAVRSSKKQKKQERADAAVPQEDLQVSRKVTVYKPAAETESELDFYELAGNININAASADELMLMKGVKRDVAEAIVTYRDEHGGFKSVFDLFKVSGIDEILFRKMTGMKSAQKRRHRRKHLASMLKIPAGQVADMKAVADAVSRKAGFDGCVISDHDGLILSQSGLDDVAEGLAAILPGMLGRIEHGMDLAGLKVTGTISIAVEGNLYTVLGADNVIFSARHAANMVSEADLSLLRKVGRELAWLLSVRAYAGPMP